MFSLTGQSYSQMVHYSQTSFIYPNILYLRIYYNTLLNAPACYEKQLGTFITQEIHIRNHVVPGMAYVDEEMGQIINIE